MKNESPQFTPEMFKLFAEFAAQRMSGPKVTFRDLWVRYEAYGSTRTEGGRTRIKGWKVQKSHAATLLLHFGDLPWDQVDLAAADGYRNARSKDVNKRTGLIGVAASTRNREMRSAQACLSYAVRTGIISRNPLAGMQDEPSVNDRDFAISQEQAAKLMRAAVPQLRWFLVLLSETGVRRGELLTMEWTEVDLNGGWMKVLAHKAKAGKERTVTLSANARIVLEMIASDGINPYVFPHSKDPHKHLAEGTLDGWWTTARDVAGIVGPKGQKVWLHTMRHSYATDYMTSGGNIEVLMNNCGWSGQAMARRYVNISPRHHEQTRAIVDARGVHVREAVLGAAMKARRAPKPIVEETIEEVAAE